MKNLGKLFVSVLFILGVSAPAQIVLQDFSAVVDGDLNWFYGTWEETGDTNGTLLPNAHFVQGTGVYDITGTTSIIPTDSNLSLVEFFNAAPVSIGSNLYLSVTAQALPGNVATSFAVTLKDTSGYTAYAAYSIGAFPNGGYTTQVQVLTPVGAFNPLVIDSLVISGNQPGGTATFNVSFDNISAVAAIPEPSTYAAILGVLALGFVAYRRRQLAA